VAHSNSAAAITKLFFIIRLSRESFFTVGRVVQRNMSLLREDQEANDIGKCLKKIRKERQ
jgi:hypothetical protein